MLNKFLMFLHCWRYSFLETTNFFETFYVLYIAVYLLISIFLLYLLVISSTVFIGILLLLLLFMQQIILLDISVQHLFTLGVYVGAILVFLYVIFIIPFTSQHVVGTYKYSANSSVYWLGVTQVIWLTYIGSQLPVDPFDILSRICLIIIILYFNKLVHLIHYCFSCYKVFTVKNLIVLH